jgi:dihydrofolate reductase
MTKLVLAMFMSLDGYIEGPGGEFIPPAWSGDMEQHWSGDNLGRAGRLLYGRKNFVFNRGFWNDPNGPAARMPVAKAMNALPKSVVSRTLSSDPGWNGAIISGDLTVGVERVKAEMSQGDLVAFGGAGLAQSLIGLDLVDEYKLLIVPSLYGGGRRLFGEGFPKSALTLVESRQLDTGAVILRYRRTAAV